MFTNHRDVIKRGKAKLRMRSAGPNSLLNMFAALNNERERDKALPDYSIVVKAERIVPPAK